MCVRMCACLMHVYKCWWARVCIRVSCVSCECVPVCAHVFVCACESVMSVCVCIVKHSSTSVHLHAVPEGDYYWCRSLPRITDSPKYCFKGKGSQRVLWAPSSKREGRSVSSPGTSMHSISYLISAVSWVSSLLKGSNSASLTRVWGRSKWPRELAVSNGAGALVSEY